LLPTLGNSALPANDANLAGARTILLGLLGLLASIGNMMRCIIATTGFPRKNSSPTLDLLLVLLHDFVKPFCEIGETTIFQSLSLLGRLRSVHLLGVGRLVASHLLLDLLVSQNTNLSL